MAVYITNSNGDTKLNNVKQHFNICVNILEARNLTWLNMSSIVYVQVGDNVKYTKVHKYSDRPFYNEYFVFDYFISLTDLLNENIILTIYKPRGKIKFRSELGSARLDVGTVWMQEGHELKNKWFALTNLSNPSGQVQGFLKCSISVKSKFYGPLIRPVYVQDSDSNIEGNLFIPENILFGRQKARYSVCIYRAYALRKKTVKYQNEAELAQDLKKVYIQISFAGVSCCTTKRKLFKSTEWDEQLTFLEVYPPLYQRLRIDVCCGKSIVVTRYINLSDISSDTKNGFPPTFGPSFLHLYSTDNTYHGSLLISIDTTIVSAFKQGEHMQSVDRKAIAPLKEALYWRMEKFLCLAVVYKISMLDKKTSTMKDFNISFCFGNNEYKMSSQSYKVEEGYCGYNWLPIEEHKPCLSIITTQPDTTERMFLPNLLSSIAQSLETQINLVKKLALDGFSSKAHDLLNRAVKNLKSDCMNELFQSTRGLTMLDQGRLKILSKKMDDMFSYLSKQVVFEDKLFAANTCITNIRQLVSDDPQDSMPSVQFSLWSKDKLIAKCNVLAQDVVYSIDKKKRGRFNAKISTHNFHYQKTNNLAGLIDVYLWLGKWNDISACLHSLPKGHQDLTRVTELPQFLTYSQRQEFVCCCHIYQGQLEPGYTSDDLYTCFVKVFVHNHCAQTEVKSSTLNPLWAEMLVIPINVYPSIKYMKVNPPNLVVEVWHQGAKTNILLGRAIVEVNINTRYTDHERKESFEWFDIVKETDVNGRILAKFEMVEKSALLKVNNEVTDDILRIGGGIPIPSYISPNTVSYRLEVQFWGIREKRRYFFYNFLRRAKVILFCGELSVTSKEIAKESQYLNFNDPVYMMDLELPHIKHYSPPVIVRIIDIGSFGAVTYIGSHVVRNIHDFYLTLPTVNEWDRLGKHKQSLFKKFTDLSRSRNQNNEDELLKNQLVPLWNKDDDIYIENESDSYSSQTRNWFVKLYIIFMKICKKYKNTFFCLNRSSRTTISQDIKEITEEEKHDWWTKYTKRNNTKLGLFKSRKQTAKALMKKPKKTDISRMECTEADSPSLVIYHNELEAQAEFDGFVDVLKTFQITRGKPELDGSTATENMLAKLKMAICLYRWPATENCVTPTGLDPVDGVLKYKTSDQPRQILVRVYAVRAYNLHPVDSNNLADPYIELVTYSNVVSDSNNYVPKQHNPVFGRCLEIIATFPQDSTLTVRMKDWDRFSSHDVIGETVIDLENRFYSSHRGSCGISNNYNVSGCNQWRDIEQPSDILERMCQENNLPPPSYLYSSIFVANREFHLTYKGKHDDTLNKQKLALLVLNHWNDIPVVGKHLVPEHVETRSLFLKDKPGVEQGKLEMWVDMFDLSLGMPPPSINIKLRNPEKFELRVVILNTAKVLLVDNGLLMEKQHVDIFVKGWLTSPEEIQSTDVHYMSRNGDGFFNWRFIFPFSYIVPEERMVVFKKEMFDITPSENKIPAVLNLQIWDKDRILPNEFIGSMSVELCRIPRGIRNLKLSKLQKNVASAFPVNLFKVKNTRGWWPCLTSNENNAAVAGYIEAEMLLLTEEEANKLPAGLGRSEPNALPCPVRPVYKCNIWMAPFRLLGNIICRGNTKKLIFCVLLAVGLFIFLGVYSIPMFAVKKIIGAK